MWQDSEARYTGWIGTYQRYNNKNNNKVEFRVAPRRDIPEFQFSKNHLSLC